MSKDKEWIDHDELTGTEEDLLKQLADSLENPPDCLSDYSKYWSTNKGEQDELNSIAEKGTTASTGRGRKLSHHGQRSGSERPSGKTAR